MSYPVVDFRKPGKVPEDIGEILSEWQCACREAIEIRFGRYIASELKIDLATPEPITGEELRQIPETSIVYRVDIAESDSPTLFILDRPMSLALVSEVLGATPEALPEDRDLTDIETTCLDFLIDEFRSLVETNQKLTPALTMKLAGRTNLRELHSEFATNMTNSEVGFRIELPYGNGLLRWIIPQEVTLDMVAASPQTIQSNGRSREGLTKLVLCTPSELSVRLGGTNVPLSTLSAISPGDVIVLDQKIDEPLVAETGGHPMFRGWSGRNGKHQVFQIGELFENESGG